jgi:uncharacterized damage-inducible protein DinB
MTYYGPKELADSYRTVRNNTIKIAEEIPAAHYGFRATPDTRSVAETLVHIAVGARLQEQVHMAERRSTLAGFDFASFLTKQIAEEQVPRSKAQIVDMLRTEGEKFASALAGVSEDFLAERVQTPPGMVPASRSRFEMLLSPKEHEMHHRGQLMLVERMLGITPHLTRQMQERIAAMRVGGAGN